MNEKIAESPRIRTLALATVAAFAVSVGVGVLIRPTAEAQPETERVGDLILRTSSITPGFVRIGTGAPAPLLDTTTLIEIPFADALMAIEDVLTTATIVQRVLFVLNTDTGKREEVTDDMVIYLPLFRDDGTTMTKQRFQFKPGIELDQETGRTFRRVPKGITEH